MDRNGDVDAPDAATAEISHSAVAIHASRPIADRRNNIRQVRRYVAERDAVTNAIKQAAAAITIFHRPSGSRTAESSNMAACEFRVCSNQPTASTGMMARACVSTVQATVTATMPIASHAPAIEIRPCGVDIVPDLSIFLKAAPLMEIIEKAAHILAE